MIVAGVVIVEGVFWVRGGRGWHVRVEETVPAPPEAVFAVLDDPATARELDPRVLRTEVVGGPGEGRLERHHVRIGLRTVVVEAQLVERDPPALLAYDAVAVLVRGRPTKFGTQRQTYTLSPAPEGTRVELRIEGKPGNAASRFAIGVRHPEEARNARNGLRRLAARDYAGEPVRLA